MIRGFFFLGYERSLVNLIMKVTIWEFLHMKKQGLTDKIKYPGTNVMVEWESNSRDSIKKEDG
ncbi:hypothetical protein CHH91_08530 [Virgibacillus sp. 7505]|nr:hypothetical protein CHH91_08530 [Virgibacillus sp. 7505]